MLCKAFSQALFIYTQLCQCKATWYAYCALGDGANIIKIKDFHFLN